MGARSLNAIRGGLAVLCTGLLVACGGGSGDGGTSQPVVTVSSAEALLGMDLLPPDGGVSTAQALSDSELPPDPAGTAVLGADELAPTS